MIMTGGDCHELEKAYPFEGQLLLTNSRLLMGTCRPSAASFFIF